MGTNMGFEWDSMGFNMGFIWIPWKRGLNGFNGKSLKLMGISYRTL